MQKKRKPGSRSRPKCKKMQKMQTWKQRPAKTQKKKKKTFLVFWPASVSRLACFLHFFAFWPAAASRLSFFLHFGCPWDLDVPSFRILPGLGRFSLENAKKCKAKFKHASKHKKTCKGKFKQASKHTHTQKKKNKQQMQKKTATQKNANSRCTKKNAK